MLTRGAVMPLVFFFRMLRLDCRGRKARAEGVCVCVEGGVKTESNALRNPLINPKAGDIVGDHGGPNWKVRSVQREGRGFAVDFIRQERQTPETVPLYVWRNWTKKMEVRHAAD